MEKVDDRLVDAQALQEFLRRELGPAEEYEIQRADGGIANETLFLTWGNRDLVLRRPPPGATAENAHEVLRDYVFFEALEETPIPVPEPVLRCSDLSVIGSEFYLAERVDGVVPHPNEPPNFADISTRRQVSEEVIDTLARVHELDYQSVGLADLGRWEGFTRRQVNQWQTQFEWATATTADVRTVPMLEEVGEWLQRNVPAETPAPSIVHGDYGLHNLMLSRETPPEIVSVLDWEMGTIGNPFVDLGWALTFWPDQGDVDLPTAGIIPPFVDREGYLSRPALVERYESNVGTTFDDPRFYLVLGTFKLAAVGEMFYARHLRGNDESDKFERMRTAVPAYAERAQRLIEADDPLHC